METSTPPPHPGQSPRLFGRASRIAATAALCLGLASGGYAIASASSSQSSKATTGTATTPSPGHLDGPGDHHGPWGPGLPLDRAALESAIAGAIGITPDALKTERESGKTLAEIAVAHGKTAADVVTVVTTALNKAIDDAITASTLTADQATALKAHVADLANHLVNDSGPDGPRGGFGDHRDGPGMGHGFDGGLFGEARGKIVTAVATALGVTETDLTTELDAGSTLAQIAVKHGKTAADMTKAVTDSATAQIDAAVAAKTLTADQATQLKSHLPEIVDHIVNSTRGDHGRGGGKCDHGDHQNGDQQNDGQAPESGNDTTTQTTTSQVPAT